MMYNILAKILRAFSMPVIKKQRPKVIGITGSVGKTSTKEAVFTVLEGKYKDDVYRSHKNLNTEVGLTLAILQIDQSSQGFGWIGII